MLNVNAYYSFIQLLKKNNLALNYRCDDTTKSDLVSFSNFLNAQDRKMPKFCGTSVSPVSSDGAFFRVTFRSNHIYDAQGFKAAYTFQRGKSYFKALRRKI